MKVVDLAALVLAFLIMSVWGGRTAAQEAASEPVSVLEGVFTRNQARIGERMFRTTCAACHAIRDYTGRRFGGKWAGKSLGDLFEQISATMPEGNPGGLKPGEYASILAFLLNESGYPEGPQDLPADIPTLKRMQIVQRPE